MKKAQAKRTKKVQVEMTCQIARKEKVTYRLVRSMKNNSLSGSSSARTQVVNANRHLQGRHDEATS